MAEIIKKSNGFLGDIPTNPLDQYDNVTYNIKLYMIPPTEDITEVKSDSTDGDERSDSGGEVTSRGGFLNGAYAAKPENTVVLAQTGVTGTLIDNVEIVSVPSGKGGKITQTIRCVIKQPGAATFLDMIVLGRRRLGIPPLSGRGVDGAPFFFEINFQGYQASGDGFEQDDGGQIRDIAGPYRYKGLLQSVDFELDSTGTTYNMLFAVADDIAFTDINSKTPTTMTTVGETIDEHIQDLTLQWNKYLKDKSGDRDKLDTYKFNLKNLTGEGQTIIKDQKLFRGKDATADANTEVINEGDDRSQAENQTDEATRDVSNPETEKIKIEVPKGTSIEFYIGSLLARNLDFTNGLTRTMIDESGQFKYDASKTLVNDVKINAYVKQVEYDKKRKGYNKEIIFHPAVFETPATKGAAIPEELSPEPDEIQRRVNSMEIKRAYEYIFTGRNDQIINVDIKYDLGINLLLPPRDDLGEQGVRFGNAALNNITSFAIDPAKPGEPLGGKALAEVAGLLQNAKKFFDIFKAAKDGSIRDIANAFGFDDATIKDIVSDRAGAAAQALVQSLSDRQIAGAIVKELTPKGASGQSGTVTESDRQRRIDNSEEDYQAEASGYIYGQDVLTYGEMSGELSTDLASAQIRAKDNLEYNELTDNDTLFDFNTPGTEEGHVDHAIYSGGPATPGQTLFGYRYGQKDAIDILYNLNMVLRGDPWYLGEPDKTGGINYNKIPDVKDEKSTDEYLNTFGGDNFILFELRQPMYFDPFTDDEDANTGLYPIGKQSYFITGIYGIKNVISSFDNGRFTVQLETYKEMALDLSKIKNKDDISLDDIRSEFEQRLRDTAGQDGVLSEDDKKRFDNPEYVDTWLNSGAVTLDEVTRSGIMTSEQIDAYKAWKANRGGG